VDDSVDLLEVKYDQCGFIK